VLLSPFVGVHAAWLTLASCVLVCGPLIFVVVKRVKAVRAESATWTSEESAQATS
jgi:hypothetical protein